MTNIFKKNYGVTPNCFGRKVVLDIEVTDFFTITLYKENFFSSDIKTCLYYDCCAVNKEIGFADIAKISGVIQKMQKSIALNGLPCFECKSTNAELNKDIKNAMQKIFKSVISNLD